MTTLAVDPAPRIRALLGLRRWAEAAQLATALVNEDPGHAEAFCLLGVARLHLGDAQGALGAARGALGIDPTQEWAHRIATQALLTLRRPKEALVHAREAVALCPLLPEALMLLGDALLAKGRAKEAQDVAYRLAAIAPTRWESPRLLGLVALHRRKHTEAEAHLLHALALAPHEAKLLSDIGYLMVRRGRGHEAAWYWQLAAQMDPTDDLPRRNLRALGRTGMPVRLLAARPAVRVGATVGFWLLMAALQAGGLALVTVISVAAHRRRDWFRALPDLARRDLLRLGPRLGRPTVAQIQRTRLWLACSVGSLVVMVAVFPIGAAIPDDTVSAALALVWFAALLIFVPSAAIVIWRRRWLRRR